MIPRWSLVASMLVLVASAALGWFLFPQLPAQIATHWGMHGEVNGTMPKAVGIMFSPLIGLVVLMVLAFLPLTDPLKENVSSFKRAYGVIVFIIAAMLCGVNVSVILVNIGVPIPMQTLVLALVGLMLIGIGFVMPYTKRNWFIGVRTPWTISSDYVWDKTHRAARTVFILLGLFSIASAFIQPLIAVFFTALILSSIGLVAYSYVLYRQER